MIVKCERCQTRFKIPDEKVTDKGVKVRCTKCQNTFRVTREAAVADAGTAPAPSAAGGTDPFARFGVAPDPKHVEITKPGYFAQGVEASRPSPASSSSATPWNSVDGDLDTEAGVFHEPTRVGPIPLPPAARPQATPFDLPAPASPGGASAGAVPLPAPARPAGPPRASTTGLYGSAVPPTEAPAPSAPGGAVPLPGGVGAHAGVASAGAGGAVPLPGVAGPRGVAPPPSAPGRAPPAGAAGPSMPAPASVTMFGPQRGGAPVPAAPVAGARPPPGPAGVPATSRGAVAPGPAGVPPASAAPAQPRRGAAPAAPPPFALEGADPFADLLGGPGPSGAPVPAGVFDDLPAPRAPAAEALRRAAAPLPTSAPTGAVALGPVRPAAAPAMPALDDDPFASIDIDLGPVPSAPQAAPKAPAPAAPRAPAPAAPAGEDPFGSIDIDDVTVTATAPGTPAPTGEDPFGSIDIDGASGPSLPPRAPAAPPVSAPVGRAPAASPASANDLFDLSSDADPFGEHSGMQPTDTGRAALLGAPAPSADGLGDFASAPESAGGSLLADVPPVDEAQEFSVTLGRVGAAAGTGAREVLDVGPVADVPAVTVARPTARPEDVGIPQSRPPSRARKVTALVANLVIAAALVVGLGAVGRVYLREGRVDLSVLSPAHLRTLVFPAARPLVAVDVSNALYETRSGRPLFFVRGEAENRTASATRIRVRAALYDGDQRVRSAEALAGTLPTPEDLYAVGNAEAATALSQRLDAAATPVAPGAKVPFLVMFPEYPADLGSFRLEVTLEPVPSAAAEAGGRTE